MSLTRWRPDLALVVAAFCFGSTFVVVRDAIADAEPVPFLAVRFLIAGAVLWPFARTRHGTPGEWRDGAVAGVLLLAGYVLQTVGLQYTTAATSAFITYLLVVFVPGVAFVVLRQRPHPVTLGGVALAVLGLVLLTGGSSGHFGKGEALTVGCAAAFAAHIVWLAKVMPRHDPVRLTCTSLVVVGASCLVPGAALGGYDMPAAAWAAAASTGLFASALAFLLMAWAQQTVTAARAAIVLLLEPVFAALLASLTGEDLSARALAGAALILVSVVVSEVLPDHLTGGSSSGQAGRRLADQ